MNLQFQKQWNQITINGLIKFNFIIIDSLKGKHYHFIGINYQIINSEFYFFTRLNYLDM